MHVNNILIVNPKTPTTYWSFDGVFSYLGIKSAHSSLALLTLAALIPKGYFFRLIDMNTDDLTDHDIQWADAVLLTGWDIHREAMRNLIWRCNGYGKPVIVGGPFASTTPAAQELSSAAAVFVGEAIDRAAFESIFFDLESGGLKKRYQAAARPPLTASPIPLFELLNFKKFADVTMQVSCGCPFRCEFCAEWKIAGAPRYKDEGQFLAELDALYRTKYRGSVFIVDDNFIGNDRGALGMSKAIRDWQIRHGYPFSFYGQGDLRLSDNEQLARLMASAGFRAMFIGIESPSNATLKQMGKKQNVGIDVPAAFSRLRSWGIEPQCGLMVGNDDDDQASFAAMEELVRAASAPRSMLGICVAMEGTDLRRRIEREGRLLNGAVGDQFDCTNILPKHMSLSELVIGHRTLLEKIYSPGEYFARSLRSIKELRSVHNFPVGWREVRAAILSLLQQGVFAPYRGEYWKFLFKVLLDDPRKIGQMFAAAVVYAHFDGYTRELQSGLPALLARIKKIEIKNKPHLAVIDE